MLYWSLLVLLVIVLSVVLPYTDTLRYGQYKKNFSVIVVLMTSHPLYVWFCYDAKRKRLIWRYAMCITKTYLFRHSWLWSAYGVYILCMCGFAMTWIEKGLYDIRRCSLRKLVYWDFSNSVVLMTFMFSNFCYDGDWQQCLYDDKRQLRQTSNSITYC